MSVIVYLDLTYQCTNIPQLRTKVSAPEPKEIKVSSMIELMELKDRNSITSIVLDRVTEVTFVIEWFPNLLQLTIKNSNIQSDLSRFCLRRCKVLYCSNNQLTSLPELPACRQLYCYDNELTSLPELPACHTLQCSNNQLTSLPELPACKELYCSYNSLTSLPELPACQTLKCYSNKFTSLPELPACQMLSCSDNKTISLPKLHPSCKVYN